MDGNNNFEDIIKNVFSNVLKDYEKSGKPIFKDGKERTPEEAEKEISEMQSKIINFSRKNEEAEKQKILYNIDEIIEKIDKEMPPLPMIRLIPKPEKTGIYDSKIGGIPYLPQGFEYPTGKGEYEGIPLKLLVQLNFEKLPHIENFPEKGILQIFCSSDDDEETFGLIFKGFDYGVKQDGFRVIYHETIETDPGKVMRPEDMPEIKIREYAFPFKGEYSLKAEVDESIPTADDVYFNDLLMKYCGEKCGRKLENFLDIKNAGFGDVFDKVVTDRRKNCCCIGGYPCFEQDDPRYYYKNNGEDLRVMLFQLPSICFTKEGKAIFEGDKRVPYMETDIENEILWGDMGIGNFFISLENLKNRDFSRVLYEWSCG